MAKPKPDHDPIPSAEELRGADAVLERVQRAMGRADATIGDARGWMNQQASEQEERSKKRKPAATETAPEAPPAATE